MHIHTWSRQEANEQLVEIFYLSPEAVTNPIGQMGLGSDSATADTKAADVLSGRTKPGAAGGVEAEAAGEAARVAAEAGESRAEEFISAEVPD
mmetsp:Transcript_19072/g.38880  ORF Transcript_19072/g.38880 Transcript_19072/m.38880 type:complete len:93 (+) Transcript_19072:29-307(+)